MLEVWGGPSADQRRDQLAAWTAGHPHLKVSFRVAEATGAGVESLRQFAAATAGGKAPHVVDFDRFQMATYALWRLFRPIDEHARRDKYDLGRFAPAVLAEARGFDRQLYGLPSSVDIRLLYWNKELFERAGLDPERPPATWDELRAAAARVTRPGGRTGMERLGFHTTEGQASLHTFAWQSGGSFQSPDGRTATLPLAPNQEALEWLVQLTNDLGGWRAGAAFRDAWGKGAQHPFLSGQLAMQYQLDGWAGDHIARHRPDLAFGVAPLPARRAGDPPFSWSGGYSFVICRDARHLDLAWELIKWLVSEPGWTAAYDGDLARARALGGVYLPGMTGQSALDRRMHEKYRTGVPALDRVAELAVDQLPHTRFRELSIAAADLWDGVLRAHVEAVSQIKSPRQALEDNNALVQRALDQAWTFAPK
jgi:ABC-type glycerol-3-phosphate transport system substrate-binding protein